MSIEITDGGYRPNGARVAMIALGLLLVLVLLAAGGVFALAQHFGHQVWSDPNVLANVNPSTRPSDNPSQTYLLIGTDTRSPEPATGGDATAPDFVFGGQRGNVIMLATVEADGQHVSAVSIPRDSSVNVSGHGVNKINAA